MLYISSFYFKFLSLSRFLKQLSQHCYTWCHSPYFPYSGWLIWREIWRQCGMSLLLYKNNPSRKRNSLQYRMGIHLIILNQKYNLHRLVTKYLITDRREIHTKLKNEKVIAVRQNNDWHCGVVIKSLYVFLFAQNL